MEEMGELLFVLSNVDRLRLLSEIEAENQRLTRLAKKLSCTMQETSKHLARLSRANLVEKDSSGLYRLTAFGRLALQLLPSFRFLSKNREYFLSHDLSFLPPEFLQRIGDLSEHRTVTRVADLLNECLKLADEAEEYFWFMTDQPLPQFFNRKPGRALSMRALFPKSVASEAHPYAKDILGENLELRLSDRVQVAIAISEKVADIAFPDLGGKVDYSHGFIGTNAAFHTWCHDLFTFCCEQSKRPWPGQMTAAAGRSST